jgi:hypothetical protein
VRTMRATGQLGDCSSPRSRNARCFGAFSRFREGALAPGPPPPGCAGAWSARCPWPHHRAACQGALAACLFLFRASGSLRQMLPPVGANAWPLLRA